MRASLKELRSIASGGGGAFIYAMMKGQIGVPIPSRNLVITAGEDLGVAGDGPDHWLLATEISVKAGQQAAIGAVLRPGIAGLQPTGTLNAANLTNYQPMGGLLSDELRSVGDVTGDAIYLPGVDEASETAYLRHSEGQFSHILINTVLPADVFSAVVTTPFGLGKSAFAPGMTVSVTVSATDSRLADAVHIDGILAHSTELPASELTFDWVIPDVEVEGIDFAYAFTVTMSRRGVVGAPAPLNLTMAIQVPALLSQTLRVSDYPGAQVALKGTEQMIATGRLQVPAVGTYTASAIVPAGLSLVSQSFVSAGTGLIDYTITVARTSAAEGVHEISFLLTGAESGASKELGEHECDVQLSAPLLNLKVNLLRFGMTTLSIRSDKRLQTPPGLASFAYSHVVALPAGEWEYVYTRNLTAPDIGETAGIAGANTVTVLTAAVGGAGTSTATISGTYKMYGWEGEMLIEFDTPFVKEKALTSAQRYAFVDCGPVFAESNGEAAVVWALCDAALTLADAPAATHIRMINGGENASGTLDMVLVLQ